MSAHDNLERQLRVSVLRAHGRRRRPRAEARAVLAIGIVVVTAVVVVVVVALLASGPTGRTPPARPDVSAARGGGAGPITGPPGPDVDQRAITAAFSATYASDASCQTLAVALGRSPVLTGGPPPAQVLAVLPALDRPTNRMTVLPAAILAQVGFVGGAVDARYVTRARVLDGTAYWLVPVQGAGHAALSAGAARRCDRLEMAALTSELPKVPAARRSATRRYGEGVFVAEETELEKSTRHDGVYLFTVRRGVSASASGGGLDAAELDRSGLLSYSGTGHGGVSRIVGVVPGGVARVTLQFASSHLRSNLSVKVVNDIFVAVLPAVSRHQRLISMIWQSAADRRIRTVDERSSGA